MGSLDIDARRYTLDDAGYLDPPTQWDEAFAVDMARKVGITGGLTEEHWRVIRYLRRKLVQEAVVPYFVVACMETGLRIHQFRALFPTGYHRGACRIAGLSQEVIESTNLTLAYELDPMVWSKYVVSPGGFLERFEAWDEGFALQVAREWGFDALTDPHLRLVRFVRSSYIARGVAPGVHEACRTCGLSLDDLAALFPDGYRRGACRMAGLPPTA
ncbi:MAG: TusE/DsrC/DsvC family sulfur relay protein [Deltaproteobacteria bacterium]|nr:TusE/DsrC/DsvC family sulfur relay protein [Deltaproteobacteria bacterium]